MIVVKLAVNGEVHQTKRVPSSQENWVIGALTDKLKEHKQRYELITRDLVNYPKTVIVNWLQ